MQIIAVATGKSSINELVNAGATSATTAVTGAMRNPTMASADGPANLLAAVQAAASPQLAGCGCVVVMAEEIHAAKHVHKMHSTSPGSFASPDTGPIGRVVEGNPRLLSRVLVAPTYPTPQRGDIRIALVTACLGDDGELLRRLGGGVDGVVLAGCVGHVPAAFASRTGSGPVLHSTYGFPGSERDLQDRGLINSGVPRPVESKNLAAPTGCCRCQSPGDRRRLRRRRRATVPA